MNVDPVRRAVDDALSAALGLPDLAPVRAMLAREPGLTGKSAIDRPAKKQAALLDGSENLNGNQGRLYR